jgi:exonuclease III
MYCHSSLNRRGVAILVRNDLDLQVLEEVRDLQENVLLMRVQLCNSVVLIGSVYGPNTNEFSFFDFLQRELNRFRGIPVVIGGDWNATYSNLPINVNPDVFSMRAVPSTARTERILQLCDEFELSDPYRALHPDWRDYTYIPSGVLRTNRSRIDYFLVSDEIFNNITQCDIAKAFCRKSFDHKNVNLSFKKGKKTGRRTINNRLISNPLLEHGVKLAVWECYLSEFLIEPGGLVEAIFHDECFKLQAIENIYNELVFLQGKDVATGLTEEEVERQAHLAEQVTGAWTRVISYEHLQRHQRKCNDDVFFEKLILITREAAIKLQNLVTKAENFEKNKLLDKLRYLKKNDGYSVNFDSIQETEARLNEIEEIRNTDMVSNYLKSDVLDNEKITPHFLRLAKTLNSDSLEKIRKDNGEKFETNAEREKHIVDFYRKLYSLPEGMPDDFTNCIEDFLGPDICTNPVVVESKLTEEERDLLDRPLSIIELDESVRKLNLKSAPGIDGVSNKFISKFWPYFREPLHRYASDCVRKGSLTETFRTAIIRLIPKKGDTTQLKNWRPISLLSCYYKIISKALNERLGKVIGKVTSMAQKAYNPDRYLHEAIINTVETIKHCQKKNVEGLLISVDLHKAFDSVFHEFMREVYKFFGFGDYFIRLSETLGNGRCAKIILDSGKFSENIELLRCRPQGDSPSPRQFNMCQQICIFKIELDPRIQSVYLSFIIPRHVAGVEREVEQLVSDGEKETAERLGYKISSELCTTKKKVSSFADDLQAAVRAEFETVRIVKECLIQFGVISGLRTNVEKTTVMRIGNNDVNLDPRITELGFTIVRDMKILGFEIDDNAAKLGRNFDKCISKIRQVIGNWSRFRLSLPGRIAIAKSLLLSQVTFPGTVLVPSQEQLITISSLIEDFVTHGIVIAKNRIYAPPKKGGLGLVNVENFIAAQKCAWIRRCFYRINDAWRWEFLRNTNFSLSTVRLECFNQESNPLLWNIANAVAKFQVKYWMKNENYLEAPVFNNLFFLREKPRPRAPDPGVVSLNMVRRDTRDRFRQELLSLKMKVLIQDGAIVEYNEVCRTTGIPFTANEYFILVSAAAFARERYGNKPNSNGLNVCIVESVYSKKGKSKKYRRYLDYAQAEMPVSELKTVKTFFGLINRPVPEPELCGMLHSLWNCQFLPNRVRFFAFQFYNNSLPTGNRVAARYRNIPGANFNDRCTFCRKANVANPAREEFVHVFFSCPSIELCVGRYMERYGGNGLTEDEKINFFFPGTRSGEWTADAELNMLQNIVFIFGIWLCKLGNKIPSFPTVEGSMLTIFETCLNLSTRLRETASNSNSLVCRLWRDRQGRG